ncbi:uncharacterized protein LOC117544075 [Gymnodraco acuticeps]|uniref:Uncharacterized protein LOC117544075 n=1 Tax=Gymnodraco acuticeps TaxID=8218 RepID=A0A6P8UT66_GYMAC|nr:uncharacterized protein LOC117544075 [Gymnodraco acuticeps]
MPYPRISITIGAASRVSASSIGDTYGRWWWPAPGSSDPPLPRQKPYGTRGPAPGVETIDFTRSNELKRLSILGLNDLSSTGYPSLPRGTTLAIRLAHLNHLHRHYKPQPCSPSTSSSPPPSAPSRWGQQRDKQSRWGNTPQIMPFSTDSQTQRKLRRMMAGHNTEGEAEEVFRGRGREVRPSFDERCFKCGSVEHWIMGLLTEHRVEAERDSKDGAIHNQTDLHQMGRKGPDRARRKFSQQHLNREVTHTHTHTHIPTSLNRSGWGDCKG